MGTTVASDAYMQIAKDGVQKGGNKKRIQWWVDAVDAYAVVFAVDSNHELENVLRVNAIRQWASSVDHADGKQQCQILFEEYEGNIFVHHRFFCRATQLSLQG